MLCIQALRLPFSSVQALYLDKHCIKYAKDNSLGGHLIIVMDQTVSQCVVTSFFFNPLIHVSGILKGS